MNLSWKLLPLMAASALALLVLMPGGGARPADVSADVTDVAISADTVASGSTTGVNVNIEAEVDDGPITVNLQFAAGGTSHTFTLTDCDGCDDQNDSGTSLSISSAAANDFPDDGSIIVRLTMTCTSDDNVTVVASQGGVSDQDTVQCIVATATPTATATATGTPATATPTITTTPSGDNTISLSAVQPNTQCGQPVFLFATVKNSNGAFVAGATVTFSASGGAGSFSPNSAVTVTDGVASSTWTPPTSGSQTVTLTATSGGKTATATAQVNCAAAAATSTPVPTGGGSTVRPPSTGDGGLADGAGWTLYAGIAALVGTAFSGALLVARRRA